MKYTIICLLGLFAFQLSAQNQEIKEVKKLLQSFKTDQELSAVEEAQGLMAELMEEPSMKNHPEALSLRAKTNGLILRFKTLDDPMLHADQTHSYYATAFEKDENMTYRQDLLNELYLVKVRLMELGNKAYEEKLYKQAQSYYTAALRMNELEIANPRYMSRDTSLLFTKALFAKLAGDNKTAIADYEELVELNYGRVDIYAYLKELYEAEGREDKIPGLEELRAMRFPE